jgi:crossover junction endodeoxyribonuclease RuvC
VDVSSREFTHVLGIDPGVTGGWCLTRLEDPSFTVYGEMPLLEVEKTNWRKARKGQKKAPAKTRIERYYDLPTITRNWTFPQGLKVLAVVELVASRPRDGAIQAFKFGDCFGQIKGVLAALGIPMLFVPPGVWTAELVLGRKDKKDHRPVAEKTLARWGVSGWADAKLSSGETDAILLAEYGRRRCRRREDET